LINPTIRLPYLTDNLPGVGGKIRCEPEDFIVEEIPLYPPCGEGTHLYMLIEKQGLPTFEVINRLARAFNRKQRDFGVAGLKDSDAITRQYISIEHLSHKEVEKAELDRIRILDLAYHKNKLKMGHLKGNRFRILIRDTGPEAAEKGNKIIDALSKTGIPNYFGSQRFGIYGNTHQLGEALLKSDDKKFADILIESPGLDGVDGYQQVIENYFNEEYMNALNALDDIGRGFRYERKVLSVLANKGGKIKRAVSSLDKRILKFYFSAFQSHYFNKYLVRRLPNMDCVEEGDAAYIHRKGAAFIVEDEVKENERAKTFEISPSGPIFGYKMLQAKGRPGAIEEEILQETGLNLEDIKGRFGIRLPGARRPLRIPIEDCVLKEMGEGIELSFFLPHGSYATVVVREITKND